MVCTSPTGSPLHFDGPAGGVAGGVAGEFVVVALFIWVLDHVRSSL